MSQSSLDPLGINASLEDTRPRRGTGTSTSKLTVPYGDDGRRNSHDEAYADAVNGVIEEAGEAIEEGILHLGTTLQQLEELHEQYYPEFESPPPPRNNPRCLDWSVVMEGSFSPPFPNFSRPQGGCIRVENHIEDHEPKCPAPALGCQFSCEEGVFFDTTDPCWSECAWEIVPTAETSDNLRISSKNVDLTQEDKIFMWAVWNFLEENRDIAEWVVCLVEGTGNAKCIRERLDGTEVQEIEFVDDTPRVFGISTVGESKCGYAPWAGGKTIHLLMNDDRCRGFRIRRDQYLGDDPGKALCAVVDQAHGILHEMLHTCLGLANEAADDQGDITGCGCDTPDMVESAFVWAIAQRYPCLSQTNECYWMHYDCMWMSACDFSSQKTVPRQCK